MTLQAYDLREFVCPGHEACPGCGAALALRLALKAVGPSSVIVMPRSCATFSQGPFPYTSTRVPIVHAPAGTAAAFASGVRAALDAAGKKDMAVIAWADPEDASGAGLAHLIRAALRREDIIYVLCDAHTQKGKDAKERLSAIIPSVKADYLASATPALPHDFDAKFKKARSLGGFRFIHVLATCPGSAGADPSRSIEIMREMSLSGAFPIYESDNARGAQLKTEE